MNNQIDVNGVKITLNQDQLEEIEVKKNGLEIVKEYYPEGNIHVKKIFKKGQLENTYHNPNGPAFVVYYKNGNLKRLEYFLNGNHNRENEPAIIDYYPNGNLKYVIYRIKSKYHREDGPALIEYYENGNIFSEKYYLNGKYHREDGPALIEYYENGNIENEWYYINDNELSKEEFLKLKHMNNQIDVNGVKITLNQDQLEEIELKKNGLEIKIERYSNGNIKSKTYHIKNHPNCIHNPNGPAIIAYYESGKIMCDKYIINGKLHREDGPAVTHYSYNGSIEKIYYFLNGKYHREDGSAIIHYFKNGKIMCENYFLNGLLHREDGPVFIRYNDSGVVVEEAYAIGNVLVDKEIFLNHLLTYKNMNNQIDVNGVKITLTEEQLKQIADQTAGKKEKEIHDFMYNLCKEMKMVKLEEKQIKYYNLNGDFLFHQDYKNGYLYYSYDRIYSILKNNFNLNPEEINNFVGGWVEKHLNWKVLIPRTGISGAIPSVEKHLNWKGLIPKNAANTFDGQGR